MVDLATPSSLRTSRAARRSVVFAILLVVGIAATAGLVGLRYALMLGIGLGFGLVLEGCRFGFAGPWRAMIQRREAGGVLAQLLSIAIVAAVAMPLLAA